MRSPDLVGMLYLLRESQEVANGGVVTLLATLTSIVVAASQSFNAGDFAVIRGRCLSTKGATAGSTTIQLLQSSGTAVFDWLAGTGNVYSNAEPSVPASAVFDAYLTEVLRCLTPGTVAFGLSGSSAGSNSSVAINRGVISVRRLRA